MQTGRIFREFSHLLTHLRRSRVMMCDCEQPTDRMKNISKEFSEAERTRFRNLLELAKGSKFEGERANALEAAKRIAKKHGMSLDEAARWTPERAPDVVRTGGAPFYQNSGNDDDPAFFYPPQGPHSDELDKKRWQEAVKKAQDRGLDRAERKRAAAKENGSARRNTNRSRRDPIKHATILLKETTLPFTEIADITGLDIYQIVGMKLKLRKAA